MAGLLHFGGDAFEVRDANLFPSGVKHNRAGKPAGGNQPQQLRFARLELKNRDGVLRAVADEQLFARLVERQRVRLRAERVARILPRANGLDDFVRARVNHAQRVAARIGGDEKFSVGRKRQRARVPASDDFSLICAIQINHRHRTFAGDGTLVHAHPRAASRRAGQAVRVGPASAPVADINFVSAQHHVERRDADIPHPQNFSGRGVQFEQPVGKIPRDIKFFAVVGNCEAGGNFIRAARRVGRWQRDGIQRRNVVVAADGKDFHVAVDIGEIYPRAVRRKFQAGEAQLRLFVRAENHGCERLRFQHPAGWQRDVLEDFPAGRIENDEFMRQAGGDEQPAVGTQRQRIRPDAGQPDLRAGGRDELVDRCDERVAVASDGCGSG